MLSRAVCLLTFVAQSAYAFCGFYVAGGGASLFNEDLGLVTRDASLTAKLVESQFQNLG